jgi:flagellar motor switch protein FliM
VLDQTQEYEPLDLLSAASTPQLRSLLMEGLSELIMRKVCFEILQTLRCKVRILSCVNGVVSHEAALSGLPNLMIAGVVDMKPAPGSMIVCVEGDLIGALVDEICGSASSDVYVRNELSNMEIRYGKKLIDITIKSVIDVFGNFMPIHAAVSHYESASGMLSIAESQTWMVSGTGILETELGFGSITIIGTYSGFEPLELRMGSRIGPGGNENDELWHNALGRLSEHTPIDVRVEVARARVPLHVVETMQVGQILPFSLLSDAVVMAGGLDAFQADYGQVDGYACFRVKGPLQRDSVPALARRVAATLEGPAGQGARTLPLRRSVKNVFESVTLAVAVELGRTKIPLKELRELTAGQVVVLDQLADEPLNIFANGQLVATGEVVAVGRDQYKIRLTSLEEPSPLAATG